MTMKNFAIVGGDARNAHLAGLLAERGNSVHAYALDKYPLSDAVARKSSLSSLADRYDGVLLPLPLENGDGQLNAPYSINSFLTEDIFNLFPVGQRVIGGKISHSLFEKAGRLGIRLYDYLEREEFSVSNAIPSAEGAIMIAMEKLPITLNSARCLVIGNGRIGKLLARYLSGFGAKVWVSARKYSDLSWISALGNTPVHTGNLSGNLADKDVIFNTVPHLILDEKHLSELSAKNLVIDLASRPGGVDLFAAKNFGIEVIRALSLPGKVAPHTAAHNMMTTILNIIDEWGDKT